MESGKDKEGASMEKAHAHVASGEEYEAQGLLACAAPEFYKAAELFLACIDQVTNPQTKQTLKLLYNENNRRGKELQRRISQSREETQNLHTSRSQSPQIPNISASIPRYGSPSRYMGRDASLAMSQRTIDDSYMVLGGRTDPQDPFNQFWNKLEQVLDNLSQPVAFATIPLTSSAENTAATVEMEGTQDVPTGTSGGQPALQNGKVSAQAALEAQLAMALDGDDEDDEEFLSDLGMDESFYVIPSVASPSMKALQSENATLKLELQSTKTRLAHAEKAIKSRQEQERILRDSIISVRREAHRAMSSSAVGGRQASLAALESTIPIFSQALPDASPQITPGPHTLEREAQYVRKIRELEDELRLSRVENEKNRATIQRFRERWEKLKESAKRKRSQKAAESARGDSVKETIQEEPELEENGA